jgi:CRP/FNR family transcriptional regulator, cyclic AMP receptor protein
MPGTSDTPTLAERAHREGRKAAETGASWSRRLGKLLWGSDCRVVRLSPRSATVRLESSAPQRQTATLTLTGQDDLSGIVTWRRGKSLGIRIASRSAAGAQNPAESTAAAARHARKPSLLDLLHAERNTVALQAGQILFKEGDPSASMFVVRSGALQIRSGSIIYENVGLGGLVGEMGIVEQHMPRSATVYALTASELVEIDQERFLALVEQVPSFALTVMQVLSRRLRHMDTRYRRDS